MALVHSFVNQLQYPHCNQFDLIELNNPVSGNNKDMPPCSWDKYYQYVTRKLFVLFQKWYIGES